MPNHKNCEVYCRLFLERNNKIGIEKVSPENCSIVFSGFVEIGALNKLGKSFIHYL